MDFLTVLFVIGITAEGMSGALAAGRERMDLFGVVMIACITGIGGGSIRDVIVGILPPSSFTNEPMLWAVAATGLTVFLAHRFMNMESRLLYVLDTLGLGIFAALGAQTGVEYGMGMWGTVFAGAVSGVGGGVMRDVLTDKVPGVFYRAGDFYASAAALGALSFYFLHPLGTDLALTLTLILTMGIRFGSRLFKLKLPAPRS